MTITAALALPSDKIYLFKGSGIYDELDGVTGTLQRTDAPLSEWPGLIDPDAAVYWGFNKVFFFTGSKYYRYDLDADKVDDGYPMDTATSWPGLWVDGVDAAFNWGNGKLMFFRGTEYMRYDMTLDKVDDGYPLTIADNWPGVWDDGVDAAFYQGGAKAYFFKGDDWRQFDIALNTVDAHGSLSALVVQPVPSGSLAPARDLSLQQANSLMADLIRRGLLTLKSWTPFVDGPQGIVSPKPADHVAVEPNIVNGVTVSNAISNVNWFDNIDQRFLIALYRLTRWINSSAPDVSEILHLGMGHGGGVPTDCHNEGRAIDLAGVDGTANGTAFSYRVKRDWGDIQANGALKIDSLDPTAKLLFRTVYTFGCFECESNGIGPANHWPPPNLGGAGFVIYPDYGGDAALRNSHQDHVHMQVGKTR